jgi:regulator of sirC expression with transglutaminase-like and TPR domain
MAVGGRLKREILAVAKFRTLYQRLVLAGQLYQYDDNEVDSAEGVARRNLALVSDDPHIIALAQISE